MAENKKRYNDGDGLKGTVPNFDGGNFTRKDVMKWKHNGPQQAGRQTPVNGRGLSTFANRTRLPRYTKK
jgi:hypothetical protein